MRELKYSVIIFTPDYLLNIQNKNIRFVMMMVILSILPFLPSH